MNDTLHQIIADAQRIVILQADNPDADSLGSALALEQILSDLGKDVYLYCGVEMPTYLRYLEGWSRVNQDVPSQFDASIIVDASTLTLFDRLQASGSQGWIASKPCIVLDHHATTDNSIHFATTMINQPEKSSTGEVIYGLTRSLSWPVSAQAAEYIMTAILGDTQGLTNELTTASTYTIMAELTEHGANRPKLEELRREASKMDPKIFTYKATLINRTELHVDGALALVTVPQVEINEFSPLYNPAPLIQADMLQTLGVTVALVIKHYDDGKILGSIRCNHAAPIAAKLAEQFGGGGHDYAAGFKLTDGRSIDTIKQQSIEVVQKLLHEITQ